MGLKTKPVSCQLMDEKQECCCLPEWSGSDIVTCTALAHLYIISRIYLKFVVFYFLTLGPVRYVAVSISGLDYVVCVYDRMTI